MLGFEAVLPSLPYLSLSLSCFLYRRSTKALLFFSWFDKNGFNSMCFYQCAFKVEKFMISGRNNSCSRMGLERKLCRLIPWDFRSPINSYQDPSLVHPGTKPQKILSLSLSLFRRSSKVVFTFIFCYPLEKFLFYALPPPSLFLSLSQVLKSSFYFHFLLSI